METIEQLRQMRASLPRGRKDPWEHCRTKRVLLIRALKRNSILEFTNTERKVVKEWTDYVKNQQLEAAKLEKSIIKTLQ